MKLYRTEPHLLPEPEPVDPTRGPTPYLLLLGSSISDSSDDDSQKLHYSCFKPCLWSSNCLVFAPCTRAKTASKTLVITILLSRSFSLSLVRFSFFPISTATNFFTQCFVCRCPTTKKFVFFFPQFCDVTIKDLMRLCSISMFQP